MDSKLHFSTHHDKSTSLYGFDLTRYVQAIKAGSRRACDLAVQALTHGGIQPLDLARKALGHYDQAALTVLERHPEIDAQPLDVPGQADNALLMYVTPLGRLHIRPASLPKIMYGEDDRAVEIGWVPLPDAVAKELEGEYAALLRAEAEAFADVKTAMDRLHADGRLAMVLEEVIDHVEHVESVGFFIGDRFLALIDRFVNLIDHKGRKGFLNALRDKSYAVWSEEEILVVASLHALFLSGRAVRFEEFNGARLTAQDLLTRLHEISEAYHHASCEVEMPPGLDLFERARIIMQQALHATGKPWLRYRWVYGLSFLKTERILPSTQLSEGDGAWIDEFADDYADLVGGSIAAAPSEHMAMTALAQACLARDVAGIPCDQGSEAVTGWIEYLMEKIVASAVRATKADYGMSSSLRDINRLVVYDEAKLVDEVHALTPNHFFTCFVSADLVLRLGAEEAAVIATSVQKRMMFNRWHFIPGNLDRPLIRKTRHWYYPPLVPDISIHADMHRAAHNRARVKYSIRCPGPDMSRPALPIGNVAWRGFYDVRVVHMEGNAFTLEDMLRTRRRTLWLESVYAALVQQAVRPERHPLKIDGFLPGAYLDTVTAPVTLAARAPGPVDA